MRWSCLLAGLLAAVLLITVAHIDDDQSPAAAHPQPSLPTTPQTNNIIDHLNADNRHYHDDERTNRSSTKLLNLTDFRFTLQLPACAPHIDVLIIVKSAPARLAHRQRLRERVGQQLVRTGAHAQRLVFMVAAVLGGGGSGDHAQQRGLQQQIVAEHRAHRDLVQANFVDSYRNLSYKTVALLRWKLDRCPHANYMLQTDDDVWTDVRQMHAMMAPPLSALRALPRHDLLLCSSPGSTLPSRSLRGYTTKWVVTWAEYPHLAYPRYCLGAAVLLTHDVVGRLHAQAQRTTRFLWMDDVFVYGILRDAAGVAISNCGGMVGEFNRYLEVDAHVGEDLMEYATFRYGDVIECWTNIGA